jgi:hypothetical protein
VTDSLSPPTTFSTEDGRLLLQRGDFGSSRWALGRPGEAAAPLFVPGMPPTGAALERAIRTASGDAAAARELVRTVLSQNPEFVPGGPG